MKKELKQYTGAIVIVLCLSLIGYTSAFMVGGFGGVSDKTEVEVGIEASSFLHFSNTDDIVLEAGVHNLYDGAGNVSQEVTASVTLKGTSLSTKNYSVYLNIEFNNFVYSSKTNTPELILTIEDKDGKQVTQIEGLEYVTQNGISGFDVTISKFKRLTIGENVEIQIPSGLTTISHDYKVTLTMLNLDVNQDINAGRLLSAELVFEETQIEYNYIYSTVLNNYDTTYEELLSQDDPDFSTISVSGEKSIHTYEDDYTNDTRLESIYFRGAVDDNWVYFGGFYWRIIRIDGAGNTKLIYSGTTAPTSSTKVTMTGTGTQIGTSYYNGTSATLNAHLVGYMYSSTENHGLTTNSTIKTNVDTWYKNNLLNSLEVDYIVDSMYCGDRIVYSTESENNLGIPSNTNGYGISTGSDVRYFASYIRRFSYQPSLLCDSINDRYTTDNQIAGNEALTYPVALITNDEVMIAGGVQALENTNYYLYTNSNWYTMSPNAQTVSINVVTIGVSGNMGGSPIAYSITSSIVNYGVRPVITINGSTPMTGTGTYNDPFTLLA